MMTTVPAPGAVPWKPPIGTILDRCPACAGMHLYAVFDGENTNFLCRSCDRCWHVTLGWVHQVDRDTCPGCEWRFVCTSRWD